jgi:hypothetical protein
MCVCVCAHGGRRERGTGREIDEERERARGRRERQTGREKDEEKERGYMKLVYAVRG